MQIIHNFLICLSRKRIHKGIRLFHQHHFKFHQPCFYLYPGANIAFVSIKGNYKGNFFTGDYFQPIDRKPGSGP